MASVWKSGRGFLAKFAPLIPRSDGKSHQQRVPKKAWHGNLDPMAAAVAWATEAEATCKTLRNDATAKLILHAEAKHFISEDQALALRNGIPPMEQMPAKPVTIEQAFMSHPSTKNDKGRAIARYVDAVLKYQKWAGSNRLYDLTLDRFQKYRDYLIAEKYAWDTRRHLMLPLRRASRMAAAQFGMADTLSGLRLDKPEPRPMVQAWTIDELRAALPKLDLRAQVAVELGAFIGLRPSETIRIRCADLRKDGRLPYAILPGRDKEAKNHASRRLLPIPKPIAKDMRALAAGRDANETLLVTSPGNQPKEGGHNKGAQAFTVETFNQWLAPILEKHTKRKLPVKCLRKTFATWTRRAKIDKEHREVYLGHETDLAQSITGQHYVADLYEVLADELEETAHQIEKIFLATQRRKPLKSKGHAD